MQSTKRPLACCNPCRWCPAAGQEEFDAITRTYYRGGGAAVIAFSTTDRASFEAIEMWKNKVEAECGDIAMALVQNKVDLVDQAVVSPTEVEGMARKLGLKLYRTCVKENINVTEVFIYLAELHQRKIMQGPQPVETPAPAPPPKGAGGRQAPVQQVSEAARSYPHPMHATCACMHGLTTLLLTPPVPHAGRRQRAPER